MSATLGGLIKDYRLQKGLPQLDIAYKVGWKDATILSRIEQGVTKSPTRAVIDRICDAMELEEEHKNHILLAGGYIPTDEEVEAMRKKMKPTMEEFKYPVFLEDFAWRFLDANEAGKDFEFRNDDEFKEAKENMPNALIYNFNKDYLKEKYKDIINEETRDNFLTDITVQFLQEHKNSITQKWYIQLMRNLMNDQNFRRIVKEATSRSIDTLIVNQTKQTVRHRRQPEKILSFYMFSVPVLSDQRFFLEYNAPANLETFRFFEK